jgi:[calcium/calmodulin-dependent protein kinase] kinase
MTNLLEFAYNEINIHKYLNHQNITKLYEIIDDENDPQ